MSINYTISVFKDLISKYQSFESLSKYLESEDGGLLKIAESENGVCIIRYEKGVSKMELPHVKWFRSVVWNTEYNYPICISPPRASTDEFPYTKMQDLIDANIQCQEFMDGFMINCFKVCNDDNIYYNTRSKLGATGKFYSDKTFRDLFNESFSYARFGRRPYYDDINNEITDSLINADITAPNSELNEVSTFNSYLVQHPEHRVVTPIPNDGYNVYDVYSGVVYRDGTVKINDGVFSKSYMEILNVGIPRIKSENEDNLQNENKEKESESESKSKQESENFVQDFIQKIFSEKDWKFQGVVFKDSNGNRWKFRSDKYTHVKNLRGNTNVPIKRFAQLFQQNLVKQYLEYYPEDINTMMCNIYIFNMIIHIQNLYKQVHIEKSISINEVDKIFHPHLYTIHGIYLTKLRGENKTVCMNNVYDYINNLPWQRTMHLLNYHLANNV